MSIVRQLHNLGLLASAYTYAVIHGTAKQPPKKIQTIVIAQTAKLGDMVCATPVFRAVRRAYPHARIIVMGEALNSVLLAHNHDIDDYVVSEQGYIKMIHAIRTRKADVGILLVPDSRTLAALFVAGVPLIIAPQVMGGFCPWQTKTYRLLLQLVHIMPHRMGHYAPREYLTLLEPLGLYAYDTTKHLGYSDAAKKEVLKVLQEHQLTKKKFAILSPSAGNKIKNWPADRFASVADHLVSKGLSVLIIGGPRDKKEVGDLLRAISESPSITDLSLRFSLDELKALIAQASLFISVDTGPLYIAEAFSVPTIDIVGPMDEREQPPVGEKHKIVVAPRTSPQLHIMNARMYDEVEARRQTEAITVEMVCAAIDSLQHLWQ